MPRTTKILNFSIPPDLFSEIERISKEKGTSRSQLLKEALEMYIASQNRWKRIRSWGEETRKKLGIEESDIDILIHEFRKENY